MKSLFEKIKFFWVSQFPQALRFFLIRASILFLGWKLIYHFRLIPRSWYNDLITGLLGKHTAFVLQLCDRKGDYHAVFQSTPKSAPFGMTDLVSYSAVYDGDRNLINISDGCNGVEMLVLYMGFLLCFSANFKHRLLFLLIGSLAIYILNVFRCVGLGLIYKYEGPGEWFDFSHHYLFTIIIHAVIFFFWILFIRQLANRHATK